MHRGYTFYWRKFWDNDFFFPKDHVFTRSEAWMYLVNHEAEWQDDPMTGLLRGQFEASVRYLGKTWNWPKSNVHRFLIKLVGNGAIARVGQGVGHQVGQVSERFIVCNYDTYNNPRDTKWDTKRTTKRTKYKEEEKKEKEGSPSDSSLPDDERPAATNPHILLWIYRHHNQHLPQVKAFTSDRRKQCSTRLNRARQEGRLEAYLVDFEEAIKKAQITPFLCGGGNRGWKADFEWFVANDSNIYSVLEGKYDGTKSGPNGNQPDLPVRTQRNLRAMDNWLSKHEELDERKRQD